MAVRWKDYCGGGNPHYETDDEEALTEVNF